MTQNELIDKLIDEIERILIMYGNNYTYIKVADTILFTPSEIVKTLKKHESLIESVIQPRAKGTWVENNPLNATKCRLIQCSECGKGFIVGYNVAMEDWLEGHNRNYCGNCGADMRGTIDEER